MQFKLEKPVIGTIGTEKYKVTIEWRNGVLIADEPVDLGGKDLGPDPYTLLMASLASCTVSTLRMYIDRKGWDISTISVQVNLYQEVTEPLITTIVRNIQFGDTISQEQEERLLIIANKCPISKILEHKIIINTTT
jgi:putative redox protein